MTEGPHHVHGSLRDLDDLESFAKTLANKIRTADFDGALKFVDDENLVQRFSAPHPQELYYKRLRGKCFLCEVLDYAGRYEECARLLDNISGELTDDPSTLPIVVRLEAFCREEHSKKFTTPEIQRGLKQEAWACLHLGMFFYRNNKYPSALMMFRVSQKVFATLHTADSPAYGSLARSAYCLGLVFRQEHEYDDARRNFGESIEYAWKGLRRDRSRTILAFNVARCLGLGLAWIAYSRAAIAEATGLIVATRLLLEDARARFINAYVEVIHACTLMSAHGDSAQSLKDATSILTDSLRLLGGPSMKDIRALACDNRGLPHTFNGNSTYAIRCIAELAHAYVRSARYYEKMESTCKEPIDKARLSRKKQRQLDRTLDCIKVLRNSINLGRQDVYRYETRTLCNTLVAETRFLRTKGDHVAALAVAKYARRLGARLGFTSIDCLLNLGESQYHREEYSDAISSFEAVRRDSRAATNPKVLAACDLHLARCCLKNLKPEEAKRHFDAWSNNGRRGMENAFIRALAAEVEMLLNAEKAPFVVQAASGKLKAKTWLKELKWWLANTALSLTERDEKHAAMELGVDVATVKHWATRWEKRNKRDGGPRDEVKKTSTKHEARRRTAKGERQVSSSHRSQS